MKVDNDDNILLNYHLHILDNSISMIRIDLAIFLQAPPRKLCVQVANIMQTYPHPLIIP